MQNLEIWKLLAGLGLFLYGMSQIETLVKSVSGRRLKLFLRRNTQNVFKAIGVGALVTGIVQSSSVVSLIVLAFVESGIITFRNALGVILGTNVGTTLSSWVVATIGFKLDILDYSLPIVAITTIGMFFFEKRRRLHTVLAVLFALGVLFLGLGFMKEGALALVEGFDLKSYSHYGTFIFVILGFVLTTIIQSSSAAVAITLTAIYAGVVAFPSAAAIVIGAEVGTTIKILLWGMKGTVDKKRVAIGNFIYNIVTVVVAYIALYELIYFIENIIRINDPLIGLVFFQTAINLISIVLFVPFLNRFSKWLERMVTTNGRKSNSYIDKELPLVPILATDALHHETLKLLNKTRLFIQHILCHEKKVSGGLLGSIKSIAQADINVDDDYQRIKQTEGDLLSYYADLQKNNLEKEDAALLLQYIGAIRQSVYAAKAIKDIQHNLHNFLASANDVLHLQCSSICNEWSQFDNHFSQLQKLHDLDLLSEEINGAITYAQVHEERQKLEVINQLKSDQLNEMKASTLMNVHREILSCKKSLLMALSNTRKKETYQSKQNSVGLKNQNAIVS
jgi:phosphate:Na+ symporter